MMNILGCMSSKTVGVLSGYSVDLNFLRRWRNLNQLVWGASFEIFGWFVG
jgi:hypothetical protein